MAEIKASTGDKIIAVLEIVGTAVSYIKDRIG